MNRTISVALAVILLTGSSWAATKTWISNASTLWTTSGNWTGGTPVSGSDTVVVGTGTASITAIPNFTFSGANFLQISGAVSHTLTPTAGQVFTWNAQPTVPSNPTDGAILVTGAGLSTISVPFVLQQNLIVSTQTTTQVTLSGALTTAAARSLIKRGDNSTLVLGGTNSGNTVTTQIFGGNIAVSSLTQLNGGSLTFTGPSSSQGSLVITGAVSQPAYPQTIAVSTGAFGSLSVRNAVVDPVTFSGPVNLGTGAAIVFDQSARSAGRNMIIGNTISGDNTTTVTFAGANGVSFALNSTNISQGWTPTFQGGIVSVIDNTKLPQAGSSPYVFTNGGILQIAGNTVGDTYPSNLAIFSSGGGISSIFSAPNSHSFTGTVTLNSAATLTLQTAAAGSLTMSGLISGGSNTRITFLGQGIFSPTNASNGGQSWNTTITNGTVTVPNGAYLGSGTITMNTGTLNVIDSGGSITQAISLASGSNKISGSGVPELAGQITGIGALAPTNSIKISNNTNTYQNGTTMASGTTLDVTTASNSGTLNALGTGTLTLNAATLITAVTGSLILPNDVVVSGTSAINEFANLPVDGLNMTGSLSGSGNLSFGGGGGGTPVFTLSGANSSYVGASTLASGGTIVLNNTTDALGGSGSSLTLGSNATLQSNVTTTIPTSITVGPTGTLDPNGNTLTLAGDLTGAAPQIRSSSGTGILQLDSTSNSVLGVTSLVGANPVTLQAGAINSLPLQISFQGASNKTLALNGFDNTIELLGLISDSVGTVDLGANVLTVTNGGQYNGSLQGSGALVLSGGTLDLLGTNPGVGTWATTIQASGTNTTSLRLPQSAQVLGSGDLTFDTGSNPGATVLLEIGSGTLPSQAVNLSGTGRNAVFVTAINPVTISGQISGIGGLTVTSSGGDSYLILSNPLNNYEGGTILGTGSNSNGRLRAGAASVLPNVMGANNTVTLAAVGVLDLNGFDQTIGGLAGTGGFVLLSTPSTSGTLTVGFDDVGSTFNGGILNGFDSSALAGNVTKIGNGTLLFASTDGSTYSGTTTISGGRIEAAAANVLSPNSTFAVTSVLDLNGFNNTIANLTGAGTVNLASNSSPATLTFGDGVNQTFSGVIQNGGSMAGSLIKEGTGISTLSGSNTYSGTTSVNAGTLRAGAAQAFSPNSTFAVTSVLDLNGFNNEIANLSGNGVVSLSAVGTSGTLTLGGNNGSQEFSGVIQDGNLMPGSVTKVGSGTLTLSGDNTYTGLTTVSAGELAVSGTGSLLSDVLVSSGATLSGTGPIGSLVTPVTVTVNGAVAPGASIGTLPIFGTYIQFDNSTLENEITGSSGNTSDLVQITGDLEFGVNTTLDVTLLSGTGFPAAGHEYVAITFTGTRMGTFTHLVTHPLIPGSIVYGPNNVSFVVSSSNRRFSALAPSGNSGAVASAVDTILATDGTAFGGMLDSLIGLSPAGVSAALNQLQPSQLKATGIAQENNAVVVRESLSQRFQTVLDSQHCYPGKGDCESKGSFLNVWMDGLGDFLHQSSAVAYGNPQVGYQENTGGFIAGADLNLGSIWYVGTLGGYTHSHLKWQENQGSAGINTGYAGAYLSAIGKIFYGNLSVIGGWSKYKEQRNIIYPGVSLVAGNNHHGKQLISHFDTGLNFEFGGITLRPFDSLDWIIQNEGGFTEQGASSFDLVVNKTHANMLRNELGMNFASCRCYHGNKFIVDSKFSWVREIRMSGRYVQSSFEVDTDVPFTTVGYFPNRNLFSAGVSVGAKMLKDRLTFTTYYNGVWGSKYSDNSVGGQLSFGF